MTFQKLALLVLLSSSSALAVPRSEAHNDSAPMTTAKLALYLDAARELNEAMDGNRESSLSVIAEKGLNEEIYFCVLPSGRIGLYVNGKCFGKP